MTTNAKNLVSDDVVQEFSRHFYGEKFPLPRKGSDKLRQCIQAILPLLVRDVTQPPRNPRQFAQAGDDIEDQRDALEDCVFISYRLLGGTLQRSQIANIRDELPEMIRTVLSKAQAGDAVSEPECPRCAECSEYLKEGETPLQRMDRDKRDSQALLSLLVEARKSIIPDELKQAIRAIIAAVWNTDIRVSHSTHIDTLRRWQKDYTTLPHGDGKVARDAEELQRLRALVNSPELHDFAKGVVLEAGHQRELWGNDHDAGKEPADWFWLLGYLSGKALAAHQVGNTDKALHHTISSAAALAHWHGAILGTHNMRPDKEQRSLSKATSSHGDDGVIQP
jgi:hypothetical protein